MSRTGLACGFALALLLPHMARAQDAATLQRRLAQLAALRNDAQATTARADSASRESLDTIAAGALRVVGRPTDADLRRRAAGIAWARLDTLYGDAAAAPLATAPLLFFLQGHPITDSRPTVAHLQRVTAPENATTIDVAFQLVRAASVRLAANSDTALTNWLGPQLFSDAPLAGMEARAYVELVTAPSIAAHHCFEADLDACRAALGLLRPGVDRVTVWYDAAERRGLVRHPLWSSPPMGLRPAIDACVLSGSDSACLDVLHQLTVEPPLLNDARQSLARLAVGADRTAFARLAAGAGRPLATRLSDAARQPIDSLISRWRVQVIAARPRPVTFAATIGWTALGWTVVFGLLALRSTRWR